MKIKYRDIISEVAYIKQGVCVCFNGFKARADHCEVIYGEDYELEIGHSWNIDPEKKYDFILEKYWRNAACTRCNRAILLYEGVVHPEFSDVCRLRYGRKVNKLSAKARQLIEEMEFDLDQRRLGERKGR